MNLALTKWLGTLALITALAQSATGAVTVTQSGRTLKLEGDATNNVIEMLGTEESGAITVTVNGATVDTFKRVRDVRVDCGAGDDVLSVVGIQIGGSLKLTMNGGVDDVKILGDNAQIERELFIGGKLDAHLGGQDGDKFVLRGNTPGGATVTGSVRVLGASDVVFIGDGLSNVSESRDIRIGGRLTIESVAKTSITFQCVNVHGATKIKTLADDDSLHFNTCHFIGAFQIRTQGGDDSVIFAPIDESNRFSGAVTIDAGPGTDETNAKTAGTFDSRLTVKGVEVQL